VDKVELRARMRDLGPIDPEVSRKVAGGIAEWLRGRLPGTIAAFLAMADEVDLTGLFELLPGWRWVLPRVEQDGSLSFRDRDVAWETHPLGMRQPVASGVTAALHELDVVLVPGLAFDRAGARLGRGGGYYDRVLEGKRRDVPAVGVTTETRVLEVIPVEDHDLDVDWLATEHGVIECSPTR
jgi:5-formyltetrahydrofolate cyclo-ligase